MKTETENIDQKTRLTEHISFYCSSILKRKVVECSKKLNESLSRTIRRFIFIGLNKINETEKKS